MVIPPLKGESLSSYDTEPTNAEILRVKSTKMFHACSYFPVFDHFKMGTPWKINMEPKHGGLEDHCSFQLGDF